MDRKWLIRLTSLGLLGLLIGMGQAQPAAAVAGAGFNAPVPVFIAPGSLITIFVQGIGDGITAPVLASALPLPRKLNGISVSLKQTESPQGPFAIPMLAVFPVPGCRTSIFQNCGKLTGINVQIPFELVPNPSVSDSLVGPVNYAQLIIQEDGGAQVAIEAMPVFDRIHVLWTGDTLKNPAAANISRPIPDLTTSVPIVTHADGSLVNGGKLAEVGETLTLWATGLGWILPLPHSGEAAPNPPLTGPVTIRFDYGPDAAPSQPTTPGDSTTGAPQIAALTSGFVGLYQVNFVVPELPAGYLWRCGIVNSNLTVSIGRKTSFDGAGICVRLPGVQ
jgi:hypothetical protein